MCKVLYMPRNEQSKYVGNLAQVSRCENIEICE